MASNYHFSAATEDIDRALVHHWLSKERYWAKDRPREVQDRAFSGSRNFGVYESASGRQVAYARVVTDGATFAWLCDVFVSAEDRGEGIGSVLLQGILDEFEPMNLKRMLLATEDAHTLYEKFGFEPLGVPSQWMARMTRPESA